MFPPFYYRLVVIGTTVRLWFYVWILVNKCLRWPGIKNILMNIKNQLCIRVPIYLRILRVLISYYRSIHRKVSVVLYDLSNIRLTYNWGITQKVRVSGNVKFVSCHIPIDAIIQEYVRRESYINQLQTWSFMDPSRSAP